MSEPVAANPAHAVRRWVSFGMLAAVQVALIATITAITVALPAIQQEMQLDETDLVFAASAYSLSFGGLLLLGGRLADQLGHRLVFILGVAVFSLASAAAALACGLGTLIAARFAQGVGAALAAPAAMALLGSVFRDRPQHVRALAIWGVLASLGASSGNVLAGIVLTWASWRWMFLLPAVLGGVVAAAAVRVLPAGPAPARTRLDLIGAGLATTGLVALIYGLGERRVIWALAGVGLIAVFVAAQARVAHPLLPPSFLTSARRAVALAAITLTAAAMAVSFFVLALYFQQVKGYSPLLTSAAFVPPALAVLTAGPLATRALGRLRPQVITAIGLAVAAAGLLLLSAIRADSPYTGLLLAGSVVFPIGAGLAFSSATVAVAEGATQDQNGLAGGLANTAMEIGPPLGLAMLIPLAATHAAALHELPPTAATAQGYGFALGAAGLALAVAAGLTLVQPRTPRTSLHRNENQKIEER